MLARPAHRSCGEMRNATYALSSPESPQQRDASHIPQAKKSFKYSPGRRAAWIPDGDMPLPGGWTCCGGRAPCISRTIVDQQAPQASPWKLRMRRLGLTSVEAHTCARGSRSRIFARLYWLGDCRSTLMAWALWGSGPRRLYCWGWNWPMTQPQSHIWPLGTRVFHSQQSLSLSGLYLNQGQQRTSDLRQSNRQGSMSCPSLRGSGAEHCLMLLGFCDDFVPPPPPPPPPPHKSSKLCSRWPPKTIILSPLSSQIAVWRERPVVPATGEQQPVAVPLEAQQEETLS